MIDKFILPKSFILPKKIKTIVHDNPDLLVGRSEKFGFFVVTSAFDRVIDIEKNHAIARTGFKELLAIEPVEIKKEIRVSRVKSRSESNPGKYFSRIYIDSKDIEDFMGWTYGDVLVVTMNKARDEIVIRHPRNHDRKLL